MPIASEAPSSNAPRAASFAVMIVEARTGNGPRTIASRRSNVRASHAYTATRPTVTIEYAISRPTATSVASSKASDRTAFKRVITAADTCIRPL